MTARSDRAGYVTAAVPCACALRLPRVHAKLKIRTNQLIEAGDHAVFFWDGKNRGIADRIEKAEDNGIPVEVARFE